MLTTYEGKSEVSDSVKMLPNKGVKGMYIKFTNIIDNLKSLTKLYSNEEMACKLLRSHSLNQLRAQTTTIEEAQNLQTLKLEDLI